MFSTGEFSKIARVSRRLLRHYRDIGLFVPSHIDEQSGYHYYSIEQLSDLNRILALRDLGFTLEQIQRTVAQNVSVNELRGMYQMRKAEIERNLRDELEKMRSIESRLQALETGLPELEVIIKAIPEQHYFSTEFVCLSIEHSQQIMDRMYRLLPEQVGSRHFGEMITILHSEDFIVVDGEVEVGFRLNQAKPLNEVHMEQLDLTFKPSVLPAVETMATVVMHEMPDFWHLGSSAIGQWMETHSYQMAGPQREIWHAYTPGMAESPTVELQIPVSKRLPAQPLQLTD